MFAHVQVCMRLHLSGTVYRTIFVTAFSSSVSAAHKNQHALHQHVHIITIGNIGWSVMTCTSFCLNNIKVTGYWKREVTHTLVCIKNFSTKQCSTFI